MKFIFRDKTHLFSAFCALDRAHRDDSNNIWIGPSGPPKDQFGILLDQFGIHIRSTHGQRETGKARARLLSDTISADSDLIQQTHEALTL